MIRRRAETVAAVGCGVGAVLIIALPAAAQSGHAAVAFLVLTMAVWIAWQDMRDMTIPDGPLAAIGFLAIADRLSMSAPAAGAMAEDLLLLAVDGVVAGGGLLVVREAFFRLRGYDGLGFGDVKLAAVCGLLVGITAFSWALLTASLAGMVIAGIGRLRSGEAVDRLPFGALLAPICSIIWLFLRWDWV